MLTNTENSYGFITKTFHWIIALAVIGLISVGFTMASMPDSPEKLELYGMHKATGVMVFSLVILRLLWRFANKTVQPVPGTPKILIWGAQAGHFLLYVFMLLMPTSGIMMSRYAGFDIPVFGMFTIPALEKNQQLATIFHGIHVTSAWLFSAIIIAHILAALYHHFVRKDEVLKRML